MRLGPVISVLLASSALAFAACKVQEVDTDTGGGGTTSQGGNNTGGDNTGGDNTGGDNTGGSGGAAPTCEDTCAETYADGALDYLNMLGCLYCGACFDLCDGGTGDVCQSGSELGCSADASDCETCADSDCAQLSICATEVDGCAANNDCVDLVTCLNECQ